MESRTVSKWMCIKGHIPGVTNPFSVDYLTPGKVYEVVTKNYDSKHEPVSYFIGDDGMEYLFFIHDSYFIPLEEWREGQLDKLI